MRELPWRRWIVGAVIGFLLMGVARTGLAWLSISSYTGCTPGTQWIEQLYRTKIPLASRADVRYIFVGGSGVHFGVSGRIVGDAMHARAVNFGSHGGLGLESILRHALPLARPGVTFVLIPEYELYYGDDALSDTLLEQATCDGNLVTTAHGVWPAIRALNGISIQEVVTNLFFKRRLHRRYADHSLDAYGDETINRASDVTAADRYFIARHPAQVFAGLPSPYAVTQFERFVRDARARGAAVQATWPNAWRGGVATTSDLRPVVAMWRRLGVPVIGCPADSMMAPEDMFDTVYHLNTDGVRVRSGTLAMQLQGHQDNASGGAACKAYMGEPGP
jgi:hypothetical protein